MTLARTDKECLVWSVLQKGSLKGPTFTELPCPRPQARLRHDAGVIQRILLNQDTFDTLSWQVLFRQATASRGIGWMYACAASTAIHVAMLLMATAARLSEPQQLDYSTLIDIIAHIDLTSPT